MYFTIRQESEGGDEGKGHPQAEEWDTLLMATVAPITPKRALFGLISTFLSCCLATLAPEEEEADAARKLLLSFLIIPFDGCSARSALVSSCWTEQASVGAMYDETGMSTAKHSCAP